MSSEPSRWPQAAMTNGSLTEMQAISSTPLALQLRRLLDVGGQVPGRAGRREGARHREQRDPLAGEIFAAGRRLGPSAVAMVSGTSGRRSPTWMVIRSPRGSVEAADRLAVGLRLKPCPPTASPRIHCRRRGRAPRFLSGKLLLAMPGMADPRFERAVIAICVHDENGAIGIGIGHKRAGISFRGLLGSSTSIPGEAPDCAVHHGGPVEPGAASSFIRPTGAGRTRSR